MSFYDDVLRQLIAALGAALFFGNLIALVRRRADAKRAPATVAPPEPGGDQAKRQELPQAPLARTLLYMLLGLVVAVWAIGSLLAG